MKDGRAALKGIVMNQSDSDMAYLKASQVSGVFEVKNELQVENRSDERISSK